MANSKALDGNALNFFYQATEERLSRLRLGRRTAAEARRGRGSSQPIYATYSGDVRK